TSSSPGRPNASRWAPMVSSPTPLQSFEPGMPHGWTTLPSSWHQGGTPGRSVAHLGAGHRPAHARGAGALAPTPGGDSVLPAGPAVLVLPSMAGPEALCQCTRSSDSGRRADLRGV